MNSRTGLCTLLALCIGAYILSASPAVAQKRGDPLKGLDAYIERAMHDWQLPGLSIAVVKGGDVIYARGFGVRELGKPDRVDTSTVFAVASHTKAFTATALAMLVGERKLRWDDAVTRHLPWFQLFDPWVTREVTLRDLLTHRTGYSTWAGDLIWYGSTLDRMEVLRRYRAVKPSTSFRSRYGYSNYGYLAAGEIAGLAAGTSWDSLVRERILLPLNMHRSTTRASDLAAMENVARPHTKIGDSIVLVPFREVDNCGGAAALNASVADMSRWVRFQLSTGLVNGRRIVDSASLAETWSPQMILPFRGEWNRTHFPSTHFSAYGLGWFLRDYQGRLLVMHDGGMDGMLSQTGFMPEEGIGVTILSNSDAQQLFSALLYAVLDRLLGTAQKDWSAIALDRMKSGGEQKKQEPLPNTTPSLPLADYAGVYAHPAMGEAKIAMVDGVLRLSLEAHPTFTASLTHWHHDTFTATWDDRYLGTSLIPFSLDETGKTRGFRMQVRPDFVDPVEYEYTKR